MDGYAIRFDDMPGPWRVIGESAAGQPFGGQLGAGSAADIHRRACSRGRRHHLDSGRSRPRWRCADPDRPRAATSGRTYPAQGRGFFRRRPLAGGRNALNAGAIAATVMAGYGALAVGGRPKVSIIGSGDELRCRRASPATPHIFHRRTASCSRQCWTACPAMSKTRASWPTISPIWRPR